MLNWQAFAVHGYLPVYMLYFCWKPVYHLLGCETTWKQWKKNCWFISCTSRDEPADLLSLLPSSLTAGARAFRRAADPALATVDPYCQHLLSGRLQKLPCPGADMLRKLQSPGHANGWFEVCTITLLFHDPITGMPQVGQGPLQ